MKNKRDIVVVIVAALVILGSVFFGYRLLFPSKSNKNVTQNKNDKTKYVSTSIDQNTLNDLQKLSEYPRPSLGEIGKSDLFAK